MPTFRKAWMTEGSTPAMPGALAASLCIAADSAATGQLEQTVATAQKRDQRLPSSI